jgi:1-acyl-sn-glycerol-3-phosphate acyltransferase
VDEAKKQIVDGVSVMMFPEGSRTKTGKLGRFHKGAYQIAIDLKLPIVPLTINGSYDVLRAHSLLIHPGKLELIIHKPIPTENLSEDEIPMLMEKTKEIIASGLWPKYK